MSEHINETGCTVNVSHITGDIVCKVPGPDCDCLITAHPDGFPDYALADYTIEIRQA